MYDFVIRQGRVIDPANGIDQICDIAVRKGRIAAIAPKIDAASTARIYDATGQIVTPGLIDIHGHVYEHVTPLGINPDEYFLRRGVTTVVDAGSSGHSTLPGFREFIVKRARCRVLAFLNISSIGLAGAGLGGARGIPGELESLAFASVEDAAEVIEENRDIVVGVKVRLSASLAGEEGRFEAEGYKRALQLADRVGLPLMVHHTVSTVPLSDCPGRLRPGDIYTHVYHGFRSTIIDPATRRVDPDVIRAYQRGVLFDIGHGQGSFNWTVGELALEEGLVPHIISSDLHSGGVHGPTYDLPTVMTRCFHLGMSLTEIIERVTIAPAKALGWADRIGTLEVGRAADITALSVDPVDMELEDCQSQMRRISSRIRARAVWRDGAFYACTEPNALPNPKSVARQRGAWERLQVRDAQPPVLHG